MPFLTILSNKSNAFSHCNPFSHADIAALYVITFGMIPFLIILSNKKPEDVISAEGKLALLEELKTITEKPFTDKLEPIEILDVSFTSFIIQ
jgi:hypothetical protein